MAVLMLSVPPFGIESMALEIRFFTASRTCSLSIRTRDAFPRDLRILSTGRGTILEWSYRIADDLLNIRLCPVRSSSPGEDQDIMEDTFEPVHLSDDELRILLFRGALRELLAKPPGEAATEVRGFLISSATLAVTLPSAESFSACASCSLSRSSPGPRDSVQ